MIIGQPFRSDFLIHFRVEQGEFPEGDDPVYGVQAERFAAGVIGQGIGQAAFAQGDGLDGVGILLLQKSVPDSVEGGKGIVIVHEGVYCPELRLMGCFGKDKDGAVHCVQILIQGPDFGNQIGVGYFFLLLCVPEEDNTGDDLQDQHQRQKETGESPGSLFIKQKEDDSQQDNRDKLPQPEDFGRGRVKQLCEIQHREIHKAADGRDKQENQQQAGKARGNCCQGILYGKGFRLLRSGESQQQEGEGGAQEIAQMNPEGDTGEIRVKRNTESNTQRDEKDIAQGKQAQALVGRGQLFVPYGGQGNREEACGKQEEQEQDNGSIEEIHHLGGTGKIVKGNLGGIGIGHAAQEDKAGEQEGNQNARDETAEGKQGFLPAAFFIPQRRGKRHRDRGDPGGADFLGEVKQEAENTEQESVDGFSFRSEETVSGVKAPENQGQVQILRHKGQGEEQVRGEGQDKQGKNDLPVFLQDPAGQEIAGNQCGRNEKGIESGDQPGTQDPVGNRVEGRKQKGIEELGKMERRLINVQGAAQEDVLGKLQVEKLIIIGDGRFRENGKNNTKNSGKDQQEKKEKG